MNLKHLIKFGMEESQEPVIKNPFLKQALEPRTMDLAEGGRIGLQGGQLVRNTVDGSRPGYNGQDKKPTEKQMYSVRPCMFSILRCQSSRNLRESIETCLGENCFFKMLRLVCAIYIYK